MKDEIIKDIQPILQTDIIKIIKGEFSEDLRKQIAPIVKEECERHIKDNLSTIVQKTLPAIVATEMQTFKDSIQKDNEDHKLSVNNQLNQLSTDQNTKTDDLKLHLGLLQGQVSSNRINIKQNEINTNLNRQRGILNTSLCVASEQRIAENIPSILKLAVPFNELVDQVPKMNEAELKRIKIRNKIHAGAGFSDEVFLLRN